jgi:hypothetical protein
MDIAKLLDDLRVVPRAMMFTYMYLLVDSSYWLMQIPDPTTQQTSYVGAILGVGAAWFGIYTNTKSKGVK